LEYAPPLEQYVLRATPATSSAVIRRDSRSRSYTFALVLATGPVDACPSYAAVTPLPEDAMPGALVTLTLLVRDVAPMPRQPK
jgi:hypothetical protein